MNQVISTLELESAALFIMTRRHGILFYLACSPPCFRSHVSIVIYEMAGRI